MKDNILNIDSRIKLLLYFLSLIIILLPIDNTGRIFFLTLMLPFFFILKINWKRVLFVLINFFTIFFFVEFFNMFFIKEPDYINWGIAFEIGSLKVYWYSFYLSFSIAFRFFLLILISLFFSTIMKLDEMVYTFQWILKPLSYFKVPTDDLAVMFSIAIRFLPILKDDINNIMLAQSSRNIFSNKSPKIFIYKIKYFSSSIIVLLTGLFEKADSLAIAMENRGYIPSKKRSFYFQNNYKKSDFVLLFIFIILFIFFIFMAIEGGDIIPRIGDVEYWVMK